MNTPDGERARWLDNPAAERNKAPLAEVLARVLPGSGVVLEVASGSGQHAEYFARAMPSLNWQPSERDLDLCRAAADRLTSAALGNVRTPLLFDVHDARPPLDSAAAIVCINMIHIAPWSACESLLRHAAALLARDAPLVLYGPFKRDGEHTAPSNAAFDASLRRRDPEWGVRDLAHVTKAAGERGFELHEVVPMPANNFTVVWRRGG